VEQAPATPVEIHAAYSGPPARAPGEIRLSDPIVYVEVLLSAAVRSGLLPANSPAVVRIGASWERGTPATGITMTDIDGDGIPDIRLRYSVAQLVADGNLTPETTTLPVWGRSPHTGEVFRGEIRVEVRE
jgi:hypothetical protein